MTLPRFHMTSKDIHAIYYSRIRRHRQHRARETERKWYGKEKKRGGVEITTVHTHIQPSTIWNHFCCVILFATKWGLNFHGLYHIVLCCARLQSEASGARAKRKRRYIHLPCLWLNGSICLWGEVTGRSGVWAKANYPSPLPLCSPPPHLQTHASTPPSMNAVRPRLTGAVLSVSTH